jgi:hypothetical protein
MTMSVETPSRIHEMAVMGKEGDTKITWSADNEHEVENARRSFDYFRSQGFAAFRVEGDDGAQGELIREFDSEIGVIVFIPPMQGG